MITAFLSFDKGFRYRLDEMKNQFLALDKPDISVGKTALP
jgi:hypothetical protein